MKVLVLGATGGTGRVIVRFRPGERPFRPCSALISVAYKSGLIAERMNPFKPQQENLFNMKAELTIDKPARAGRATQIDAMAGVAAPPFHPILTDAGGGPTFTMLGTTMRLLATTAGTGGRYTVIEQVTPPSWGPPRHIHSCEDETFYILDGSYELHVGDERRTVSAGASAILPRNIPHGFRNVASTPSRLVFVITPGGLEEYFLAVARCSPAPNPTQLVELARPFGLTLLPPGV